MNKIVNLEDLKFKFEILTNRQFEDLKPLVGNIFDIVFFDYVTYSGSVSNAGILQKSKEIFLNKYCDFIESIVIALSKGNSIIQVEERESIKLEISKLFNFLFTEIHNLLKEVDNKKKMDNLKNSAVDYLVYLIDLTLSTKKKLNTLIIN